MPTDTNFQLKTRWGGDQAILLFLPFLAPEAHFLSGSMGACRDSNASRKWVTRLLSRLGWFCGVCGDFWHRDLTDALNLPGWVGRGHSEPQGGSSWLGRGRRPRAGHGGFEEQPVMPRALCPHACPPIGRDPFLSRTLLSRTILHMEPQVNPTF